MIKLLLTLSHGQPAVERGFSVNSSLLQPNLRSNSLIAQRVIYDAVILTEHPIAKFQVTPELLRSCSLAYRRYTAYLQQKVERANKEKRKKRAREENEVVAAKKKLKQLESAVQSLRPNTRS